MHSRETKCQPKDSQRTTEFAVRYSKLLPFHNNILHQNLDHKFYIFTDESSILPVEQYTTVDKYLIGRFDPKVVVKCSGNCKKLTKTISYHIVSVLFTSSLIRI